MTNIEYAFDPICPSGGISDPLSCICVYLCKYTYKLAEKNLTFHKCEFGKGQYAFYPVSPRKKRFVRNTRFLSGGTLINWVRGLPHQWKFIKVNHFFGLVLVIQTSWILMNMVHYKSQCIRVSPVQSRQGPQQSPVFSSISNFYCRRKFLKVILTREYFDGIIW